MAIIICVGLLLGFWGMAVIMHVCSKSSLDKIEERKKDCVTETTATVQEIKEERIKIVDDYNYTWYPIYQYYVNGEPVVQKSEFGGDEGTFQKGQQVILYYNPENPNEIFVPEEKPEAAAKIFQIMYKVCTVCGYIIIITFIVVMVLGLG